MQNKRAVWSWALYDWANSVYATAVMAGFFPVFFKNYWGASLEATQSTFYLGLGNSAAGLMIVLSAPILGSIADRAGRKKAMLGFFAFLGIVMTALLSLAAEGQWQLAMLLYVGATIGFSGSVVFSDSLIVDVAEKSRLEQVSSLGYALGYAGGGLLFAVNVLMVSHPDWFGLADATRAVKLSYLMVAVWWLVFSLPLLLFVREHRPARHPRLGHGLVRAGFVQLRDTFREIRGYRITFTFLIGYWFYIDGVDTVVRMAVDYGITLGFAANDLIVALLITQFVGFPSALAYGYLGERYGAKRALFFGIFVYILVIIWASRMDSLTEFYSIAIVIGLVQGGVQALSRSVYARIIPVNRSAEFFGFYNMVGKFAVVLGPAIMGGFAVLTGSTRQAILSVSVLFLIGAWFLYKTDIRHGEVLARQMSGGVHNDN
jgi:UMF1 family MFS transporter